MSDLSAKYAKWDKLAKEVEEEEKGEEGSVEKCFQQIYHDANDDVKKAMIKSFTESKGTVLSTNWNERLMAQKSLCAMHKQQQTGNDELLVVYESATRKVAKYRRFQIHPLLDSQFTTEKLGLIEAAILKLNDKRLIGRILRVLPPLPANFSHLKRVKDHEILIAVDVKPDDPVEENFYKKIADMLKETPQFGVQNIPRFKPKTREQFDRFKKYWPVSFTKDALVEAKIHGTYFDVEEVERISNLFMHIELRKGALFYDSNKDIIISQDTDIDADTETNPLSHPVMNCIQALSLKHSSTPQSSEQYLATGFDAVLAQEPCAMCAMALVHCRVKRIFFGIPNVKYGALKSRWRIQEKKSLNHHFEVFQIVEIDKV